MRGRRNIVEEKTKNGTNPRNYLLLYQFVYSWCDFSRLYWWFRCRFKGGIEIRVKKVGFIGKLKWQRNWRKWKCGNGNFKYWNEELIKWPRVSVGGNEIIIDLLKCPKVCRKDFNWKGSLVGLVVVTNSSYIVEDLTTYWMMW